VRAISVNCHIDLKRVHGSIYLLTYFFLHLFVSLRISLSRFASLYIGSRLLYGYMATVFMLGSQAGSGSSLKTRRCYAIPQKDS
jgi:hypothetical protein